MPQCRLPYRELVTRLNRHSGADRKALRSTLEGVSLGLSMPVFRCRSRVWSGYSGQGPRLMIEAGAAALRCLQTRPGFLAGI